MVVIGTPKQGQQSVNLREVAFLRREGDGGLGKVVSQYKSRICFVHTCAALGILAAFAQQTLAIPASLVGTVPETQLGWATGARVMTIIEPRGGTIIGRAPLPATAR